MSDAATIPVTFDGTSNRKVSKAESVEVDGITLTKGGAPQNLTKDQLARVEALPGLKFTTGQAEKGDELLKLERKDLDAKAREAGVTDPEKLDNKEAVAAAIREAEGA